MKLALAIGLALALIFVGSRAFSFWGEQRALNKNLSEIESRLQAAKSDEANLQEEMKYLANPVNLEKELRAQFNYKKPGEKMIIIVPATTSTKP